MREASWSLPKPLVPLAGRPVLWHIMRYYAHFGHREFVLCLGYRGDAIREYFLDGSEKLGIRARQNGSVGAGDELLLEDMKNLRITCVDTGEDATIAERLLAVRSFLGDDEIFLANYGDVLTDAPLPQLIETVQGERKIATFLLVRPTYSFHVVTLSDGHQLVKAIETSVDSGIRINGGYFVFRREIFDYIEEGEELVDEPFQRLIANEQLLAYPWDGFWAPMDTFKDKQTLEALAHAGSAPWRVWDLERSPTGQPTPAC